MSQIIMYVFIIVLTFLVGFPVVLCSKGMKANWIPASFSLGTAILILIAFWISNISRNGLKPFVWYVVIAMLLIAVTMIYRERSKVLAYFKTITISDIVCLTIAIVSGIIPMTIYILYGAQFPYVDGYTYLCNADYLMDNGYWTSIDVNDMILHPWLSQMYLYQTQHFRIGSQMLLALLSCLSGQSFSIEVFLPLISFAVFLTGMGGWLIICSESEMSKYTKIMAVTLLCFNIPIILWNAMQGYLPQLMGSALFLGSLSCFLTLDKWQSKWDIVTASLLIGSFALTYNEMLPFFVLVVLVIALCYIIRNKIELLNTVKKIGICGVTTILLILPYFPGMIKAVLTQLGVVVGWNQVKDINTYLAYFMSTVPAEYSFQTSTFSAFMLLAEVAALTLFVVTVVGAVKSDNVVRRDFISISIPYAIMLLYFIVCTENPFVGGRGNTWSIFKLMQYYFIPAAPFIAIFMSKFLEKNKVLMSVFLIAFIIYNGVNGISYAEDVASNMENYVGKQEKSLEEYYKLYEKYNNSEDRYALNNIPLKHRQLITYFLKDVELVSDWKSDDYFGTIPEVPEELYVSAIPLTYDIHDENNIAGLVEKTDYIFWGEGSYAEEISEESYWRWCNKETELIIYNTDSSGVEFAFEVYALETLGQTETIKIYSGDGILLKEIFVTPNQLVINSIELEKGINTLRFVYSGSTHIPGNGDFRELAFAIQNYQIIESR